MYNTICKLYVNVMTGRVCYKTSSREPDKVKAGTNEVTEDGPRTS